jgi:hypothetical protein
MAGQTTLTVLNSAFKYIQEGLKDLLPDNSVLMKAIPQITEATKEGRKFLVSVQLSHENGITFGDGTVFALNNASSAVYGEIQVDAQPVILLTQISESVANRMANSKQTFLTEATLRSRVMMNSLTRAMEITMLYGQSATGLAASASCVATSSTVTTVTFSAASWSPGIWAGAIGAVMQFYTQVPALVSSGADSQFTVSAVSIANKTVAFTSTATGATALVSAIGSGVCNPHLLGAYTNAMLGLDSQIVGGVSFFGIDPTVYPLWQGQSEDCGNASLTMAKVLDGVGKAVAAGGLVDDCMLMVSTKTFGNLNSDLAALRMYDSSYSSKEADNGSEDITYHGPNGKITVKINNIVKEGEAFAICTKFIKRVGAKEISFERPGKKDEFFQEIPGFAGYSLRAGCEFAVVSEAPAKMVKFVNIVNS